MTQREVSGCSLMWQFNHRADEWAVCPEVQLGRASYSNFPAISTGSTTKEVALYRALCWLDAESGLKNSVPAIYPSFPSCRLCVIPRASLYSDRRLYLLPRSAAELIPPHDTAIQRQLRKPSQPPEAYTMSLFPMISGLQWKSLCHIYPGPCRTYLIRPSQLNMKAFSYYLIIIIARAVLADFNRSKRNQQVDSQPSQAVYTSRYSLEAEHYLLGEHYSPSGRQARSLTTSLIIRKARCLFHNIPHIIVQLEELPTCTTPSSSREP